MVAVLIFVQSMYANIDLDVSGPSFINSPEVYQCCISKSDNLGFKESFKPPSPVLNFILKLKGYFDELNMEEQERLI